MDPWPIVGWMLVVLMPLTCLIKVQIVFLKWLHYVDDDKDGNEK